MSDLYTVAVPTWITGVGTVGLATLTYVLMRRETRDRARLQAIEDKRMEREVQAQAHAVAAWYAEDLDLDAEDFDTEPIRVSRLVVSNQSAGPCFEVVVSLVIVQGAGPGTGEELVALHATGDHEIAIRAVAVLPPGVWYLDFPARWHGMHRMAAAEIGFTDAAGRHWIRRASGSLEQINCGAPTHYRLWRPFGYWLLRAYPTMS